MLFYHIYDSQSEEPIAKFAAVHNGDQPLPHLEVGNELVLPTESYSQRAGFVLVIERIRIVVSHPFEGTPILRCHTHVFCKERPLQQRKKR
jgi:hypothetical protein